MVKNNNIINILNMKIKIAVLFFFFLSCINLRTDAQSVEIVKWDYIENLMNQKSDTLYVTSVALKLVKVL